MTPIQAAAAALIALAIFDWLATAVLVRAARSIHEPALTERAIASFVLTVGASGAGILSWAYLASFDLPDLVGTLFLIGGLAILSLPQIVWLGAYLLGRFR